jgi:hypothetical protein
LSDVHDAGRRVVGLGIVEDGKREGEEGVRSREDTEEAQEKDLVEPLRGEGEAKTETETEEHVDDALRERFTSLEIFHPLRHILLQPIRDIMIPQFQALSRLACHSAT